MIWIFLAVVLVLCVVHRTFRRLVGVLACVAVLLGAGGVLYLVHTEQQNRQVSVSTPPLAPEERQAMEARLAELDAADRAQTRLVLLKARRAALVKAVQDAPQETADERWQRLMRTSRQP